MARRSRRTETPRFPNPNPVVSLLEEEGEGALAVVVVLFDAVMMTGAAAAAVSRLLRLWLGALAGESTWRGIVVCCLLFVFVLIEFGLVCCVVIEILGGFWWIDE